MPAATPNRTALSAAGCAHAAPAAATNARPIRGTISLSATFLRICTSPISSARRTPLGKRQRNELRGMVAAANRGHDVLFALVEIGHGRGGHASPELRLPQCLAVL